VPLAAGYGIGAAGAALLVAAAASGLLFAVVDRIGPTQNLEEYRYPKKWRITAPG
jgi:hypothetical protein